MAVTTLTGTTWTLKSAPDVSTDISVEVSFKYYGDLVEYDGFVVFSSASSIGYYRSSTSSAITVYYDGSWGNEDYRTITFTSEVTDGSQSEFIAWLEANSVSPVREISKIKLPDGSEYNFKDTVSGYITSAPVTSVNGQTGNVTVQGVLTAGTGITIANNVISLNVTVVNNEYGGQTITIGG